MSVEQTPGSPGDNDLVGRIGDIAFTPTTVYLPGRAMPMAGSVWVLQDTHWVTHRIPAWAIVCTCVFAPFCLLGLLFLLAKEEVLSGAVDVEVRNGADVHRTRVQTVSAVQHQHVLAQVEYARQLSVWAAGGYRHY